MEWEPQVDDALAQDGITEEPHGASSHRGTLPAGTTKPPRR